MIKKIRPPSGPRISGRGETIDFRRAFWNLSQHSDDAWCEMADENGTERPDRLKRVVANLGGAVEWTSDVRTDSQVNVEWATVLGGLPDLSPEEAIEFYARVSQALPTTRVRGFYGAMDGSDERADDLVLFLYRDDPKRPVLKLVMSRSEMLQFADALSGLVERFRP